jgi:GntR family transcriptional repressor for pyruvate dehydrogenase complex
MKSLAKSDAWFYVLCFFAVPTRFRGESEWFSGLKTDCDLHCSGILAPVNKVIAQGRLAGHSRIVRCCIIACMAITVNGRPARSGNLADRLVETFSENIRGCTLRAGEKLPKESEIALRQGVSRTVVREAISRLQAAGLVETRHGIGTFVLPPANPFNFELDPTILTIREVLAMLELRIHLEAEATALAAARRSENHLMEMRRALDAFASNLENPLLTCKADYDFHLQVAQATENRYYADVISRLSKATIPRTRIKLALGNPIEYLSTVHRQHEDIYGAILGRDPASARMLMRLHLNATRERLRRAHDAAQAGESRP